MPRDNVLQFPPSGGGGGFLLKLYAVFFYAMLAAALGVLLLLPAGLDLLLILGLLYSFFERQKIHRSPRFKQFLVVWIILGVLVIVAYWQMAVLVLVLAVLYKLLVARNGREAPYFVRFHLMTALLLNFFILMPLILFNETLGLLRCILELVGVWHVSAPAFLTYAGAFPLIRLGLFALPAIWLSIAALMGRTPYIRWVTGGVRSWV